MIAFSLSEVRQNLDAVLDEAALRGGVEIRRDDGRTFVLRPAPSRPSPLDVPGVKTDVTAEEIVAAVRESRDRE
jgi:hypothetical protein